ncbi:Eco29kI family restriction endonuclease [Streptomyces fradiae]|uniref:Eco29kI family restriction endonuclease n=1 Tax=Streptomyces fradiae TaxID=1906 RepID=UPI00365FB201
MAEDPATRLGKELTRLRLLKGLNVNELVSRCAPLGRTTISKALNAGPGRGVPTPETVVRICRALGADSVPLLELVRQAKEDARTPRPGPQAEDRSRQFTREPENPEPGDAELTGMFNPLRRENLERSVQWALESAPPIPLAHDPATRADGIYAVYYTGRHPLYRPVSTPACTTPLYVGTARPSGYLRRSASEGPTGALNTRLKDHRTSIDQAEDLELADFHVRYLPVEEVWISGAGALMVGDHRPIWNTVVEGFGHHNPGTARRDFTPRSPWDELHPGRPWAVEQRPAKTSAMELRRAVRQHIARLTGR